VICDKCHGSGAKNPDDVVQCRVCGGKGVKIIRQQIAPGFIQQIQVTCDVCGGKGKTIKSKCPVCDGKKVKRGTTRLSITIEKGMKDLHEILFEQEGDQYPDVIPGDIIFVLRTSPHAVFNRSGDDLYMKQSITLKDALLGFSKKIKQLDGTMLEATRQGVTQPSNGLMLRCHHVCLYPSNRLFRICAKNRTCRHAQISLRL
jgi:DnaJ-related protein SCJ1